MSKQYDIEELRTQAIDAKAVFIAARKKGVEDLRMQMDVLLVMCDKMIYLADEAERLSQALDDAHSGIIDIATKLREMT